MDSGFDWLKSFLLSPLLKTADRGLHRRGREGGGSTRSSSSSSSNGEQARQATRAPREQHPEYTDSSPSRLRLQDLLGAFQRGERKITGGQVRQAAELGVPVPPTHLAGGFDAVGDILFSFGGQTRR